MANFSLYYPKLLVYEGGYASAAYAAKMGDTGGETYLGIARNYNKNWPGWQIIDAYKVKNGEPKYNSKIDDPELYRLAGLISKADYWDKMKLDQVHNQSVAEMIGDYGFNSGISTSVKATQNIIGTKVTGVITDDDIQKINAENSLVLFTTLQSKRVNMIKNSTKITPKFKAGLTTRAMSFKFTK